MTPSLADEYRQCAEMCRNTDYTKPLSVRAHNRAAGKMKELVKKAEREGGLSVRTLATLLDEPLACEWLSFQLLDTLEAVPPDLERKCLGIIEGIAEGSSRSADAAGAQRWLAAWKKKRAARDR